MYAMVLKKIGAALEWTELADPRAGRFAEAAVLVP